MAHGEDGRDEWSPDDRVKLGQLAIDAKHSRRELGEIKTTLGKVEERITRELEAARNDVARAREDFLRKFDDLEEKYVTKAEYKLVWTVFSWVGMGSVAAILAAFYKLVLNP